MQWEDQLRALADTQEGLVARIHLPAVGCTYKQWDRAKTNGRWEVLTPRVIRARGAPETEAQRVLAAVLDASPGAMLHGPSALGWCGLPGFPLADLHVARPRDLSSARPQLATLHQLRDVRPHDLIVVRGVPTETPLRAIWTEAARWAPERVFEIGLAKIGNLLDAAHRHNLITWAALHEMVDDIRERGRAGTVLMRTLAASRRPGTSPTESRNEDRLEKILANAGEDPLRRQPVVGGHEPIGRCDFRDRDLPLAVEVNSLTFHTTPSDREADEVRYRRLCDAGFTVAVIWEVDLWARSRAVVRTIREARKQARARCSVVLHSPSCPWPA